MYSTSPLSSGQSLQWIQIGNDNDPLYGTIKSPYVDGRTTSQFYLPQNRNPALPPNMNNFYDFSTRSPSDLSTVNPISWSANLYPVVTDGTNVTIENGVTWGWTMKPATVGEIDGSFSNPVPSNGSGQILFGRNFLWGEPWARSSITFSGDAPSTLGNTFNTKPGTPFALGRLSLHNGRPSLGVGGADPVSVDLNATVDFYNVSEDDFTFTTPLTILRTPYTPLSYFGTESIIVGHSKFSVLQDETGYIDIMAEFTPLLGLEVADTGPSNSLVYSTGFNTPVGYALKIVGLEDPSRWKPY
jgi:hypothetical protein